MKFPFGKGNKTQEGIWQTKCKKDIANEKNLQILHIGQRAYVQQYSTNKSKELKNQTEKNWVSLQIVQAHEIKNRENMWGKKSIWVFVMHFA